MPQNAMACQQCHQILAPYRNADNATRWVHDRPWLKRDHAPQPVPAHTVATEIDCDICAARPVTASWTGEPLTFVLGENKVIKYSGTWNTCRSCDRQIQQREYKMLLQKARTADFALRTHPEIAALPDEQLKTVAFHGYADHRADVIGAWLRSGNPVRTPIKKPKIAAPIKPSQLPRHQTKLVEYWATYAGNSIFNASRSDHAQLLPCYVLGDDYDPQKLGFPAWMADRDMCEQFAQDTATELAEADAYWVSSEFVDRAVRGARKLTEYTISEDDLPAPTGFMLLESAFAERSLPDGTVFPLSLITWRTIGGGVWFTFYGRIDLLATTTSELLARTGAFIPWSPGGGATFAAHGNNGDSAHTTIAIMLSIFAFMNTERVTDIAEVKTSEQDSKRVRRVYGTGAKAPTVRVVDIRRRRGSAGSGPALTVGQNIDYQMEVEGHFKQQFYGEGRKFRKRIWVDAYWKGPEDAPVRFKGEKTPVVKVLK